MNTLKEELSIAEEELDLLIEEYIGTYPKPFNYRDDVAKLEDKISNMRSCLRSREEEQKMIFVEQEHDYDEGILL